VVVAMHSEWLMTLSAWKTTIHALAHHHQLDRPRQVKANQRV